MSKATYHVPQYREVVSFDEVYFCEVESWDSKHSTITTTSGERIRVKDRSSIKVIGADSKPAEPAKAAIVRPVREEMHINTPFADLLPKAPSRVSDGKDDQLDSLSYALKRFKTKAELIPQFLASLPTSFASEVERAQAIADAEAEEKKRSGNPLEVLRPRKSFPKQKALLWYVLRVALLTVGACAFFTSGILHSYLSWHDPLILAVNFLGTFCLVFPVFHR